MEDLVIFEKDLFLGDRTMRSYIGLITVVILAISVSTGFAQDSAGASEGMTSETPSFPYLAEITGNDVYIRSGPGTNFYQCGKLNKGDRIKVLGRQFSWSRIVPPAGSFSWISMQYVRADMDDPSTGTVTGDNVRVYAGSDYVKPLYSTSLQGKLNKGDKVKLLGEQLDEYYKIAPPAFAHLWVTTNFTKPAPVPVAPVVVEPEPVAVVPSATEPEDTNDTSAVVAVTPEEVEPSTPLQKYYALKKKLEIEREKPIEQQDYKELKQGFAEIADNKDGSKASRFAEYVVKQIDAIETALAVAKQVELQDKELEKINAGIEKAKVARLAEIEKLGKYAVIGQLQTYATFGPGNYRVVDESGKMLCFALPDSTASQMDLSRFVGKKVGLMGVIEAHKPTKQALVRFTEVVEVE